MTQESSMEKHETEVMRGPNGLVRAHIDKQTLEMTIGVIDIFRKPERSVINGGDDNSGYVQLGGPIIEKTLLQVAEDITWLSANIEGWRFSYDDKRMEREMDALEEASEEG